MWLFPSGSPTRTQESGDSKGRGARTWHVPALVAQPAAEDMERESSHPARRGILPLPSAVLWAVGQSCSAPPFREVRAWAPIRPETL